METKLDKEDIKQIQRIVRAEINKVLYKFVEVLREQINKDEVEQFGR